MRASSTGSTACTVLLQFVMSVTHTTAWHTVRHAPPHLLTAANSCGVIMQAATPKLHPSRNTEMSHYMVTTNQLNSRSTYLPATELLPTSTSRCAAKHVPACTCSTRIPACPATVHWHTPVTCTHPCLYCIASGWLSSRCCPELGPSQEAVKLPANSALRRNRVTGKAVRPPQRQPLHCCCLD